MQDKSNRTGQHNSILGLIFSTQSTKMILSDMEIELAQKIRFSITRRFTPFTVNVFLSCNKDTVIEALISNQQSRETVAGTSGSITASSVTTLNSTF